MIKPGRLVISTKLGIKKYESPEAHQADIPFETVSSEDNIGLHIVDLKELLDKLKEEHGEV